MKKLCSVAMLLVVAVTSYAQNDVTKFLGIPVDGFKRDMIDKLKEKGFVNNDIDQELLEGEFNGQNVLIGIGTNNNKVYRIMVADTQYISEGDIKIRFNKLFAQFENNPKYKSYLYNKSISDEEKIYHEILVNKKRYEAAFYQDGDYNKSVWFMIDERYGKFRILIFYDNLYNQANGEDL